MLEIELGEFMTDLFRKFFLVCACVSLLISCSVYKMPEIGDEVSGPFALSGQPGTNNVFVINSAFSGDFSNGNILRYQLRSDGSGLEKKEAYSVPRLGNDIGVSPDGKILVASFQGEKPKIKVFQLSAEGKLSTSESEFSFDGGVVSQIQFFSPSDTPSNEHWFTVVQDPLGSGSKSFVFRVVSDSQKIELTKILTLPDDLPDGKPEDFSLGYSSPAYVLKQDLMIFFPQGGNGVLPVLPDPLQLNDSKSKPVDARHVSLVVVDFTALRKNRNVGQATAFLAAAYDVNGTFVDTNKSIKEAPNKDVFYRTGFTTSIGYAQTGCTPAAGAPTDPSLPEDSVIVAEGTPTDYSSTDLEQVMSFSNFDSIAESLRSLPILEGKEHFKRKILSTPKIRIISRKKGAPEIDTEEGSYIRRIAVANVAGSCVPLWLRSERSRAAFGEEVSRFSFNFNRDSKKPILSRIATRGSLTFGVLSVKAETPERNRVFAFSPSFSYGNISGVEVKSTGFSPLK